MCQNRFATKKALSRHWNSQHPEKPKTTCTLCHKTFTREYSLLEHTRVHLNILPFPCKLCNTYFPSNTYLASHQRKKHKKQLKLHQRYKRCPRNDKGKYNEKKSVSLNNKNSEVKDKNNKSSELKKSDSMFSCDICYKIFSDLEDCIKHERKHSQILKTSRSGRPLKAVVINSSEIREGRSDKENEINNTNTDQNCSDEEHIKENNDDVKVIETIEKACSPILEVVPTIKEIVGFKT